MESYPVFMDWKTEYFLNQLESIQLLLESPLATEIVKVTPILKLNFKEPRMAKAILEKNKIGAPLALKVLSVFENICFVLGRVWMVPLEPTEHIEIFCFALVNFITSSRRCR